MTLEQKLGQMTQPDLSSLSSNDHTDFQKIKKLGLGSVLVGGNGAPTNDGNLQTGNLDYHQATRENWKKLGDKLMEETVIEIELDEQEVAKIQLLLGTDAVHGNQHVIGEVLFPHNIGLAATFNPEHFYLQGQITANNTLASGWNYLFAPTVAVSHNAQWGRYYETLGQNSDMIKKYANEFVNGAQQVDQDGFIRGAMTSTKHFLGDGATYEGRDEGNDKVYNFTAFLEHNIQGYRGGIEAQTGTIMCSYSAINSIPMAINADLLQNVLKEKEGFSGFIISDYNERSKVASQGQPTSNIKMSEYESTCLIVNAGMDMMMMGGGAEDYISDLKKCVENGEVAMDRIDDAVKRILAVKMAMGIVQIVNNTSVDTDTQKLKQQQPVDPQFVAQSALKAAKESLVLLKNDNNLLPINLSQIEYVILIGERDIQERENYQVADEYVVQDTNNIGAQNGGWSVRWQGYEGNEFWSGEYKNSSSAFSIFDSLVNRLGNDRILKPNYTDIRNYTQIRRERSDFIQRLQSLNLTSQNTLIIGALTESPYAEYMGEINNSFCKGHMYPPAEGCLYINGYANPYMPYEQKTTLEISYDDFSQQVLSSVSSNIPLITVLITGRPMLINDEINRSTSFISAWLPGTTGGEAIVQAIFGEYLFGQNGYSNRLPIDWVQNMEDLQQFPIYNQNGDIPQIKTPLFQMGYGIYTQNSKIEKNIQ
ncbi:hypothetical protein ABPG74_021603 [Tetrahymena malaccensis]